MRSSRSIRTTIRIWSLSPQSPRPARSRATRLDRNAQTAMQSSAAPSCRWPRTAGTRASSPCSRPMSPPACASIPAPSASRRAAKSLKSSPARTPARIPELRQCRRSARTASFRASGSTTFRRTSGSPPACSSRRNRACSPASPPTNLRPRIR